FIGYFLATLSEGSPVQTALKKGAAAAALCVSRKGAMAAIPTAAEVNSFLAGHNCCH
ncbi:MAG: ribokinase, partial [Lentisphaerae bacterium]